MSENAMKVWIVALFVVMGIGVTVALVVAEIYKPNCGEQKR